MRRQRKPKFKTIDFGNYAMTVRMFCSVCDFEGEALAFGPDPFLDKCHEEIYNQLHKDDSPECNFPLTVDVIAIEASPPPKKL